MAITLFYDDISPPVRSVLMLIKHLQIAVIYKTINLFKGEHLSSDYLKINPLHTVPTLEDGDYIITDSQVILIYLAEKYGINENLLPNDLELKTTTLSRLFFNSSIFFRRDSDVMTEIFAKRLTNMEKHLDKIRECFGILENYLGRTKYIASDYLTIADFSIVATLSTVELLTPIHRDQWPKTWRWYQKMKELECYLEGNQTGVNKLEELLKIYNV